MLYIMQFAGSYVLMLIVMTYNTWILVATVLGLGVGYFLCGWGNLTPKKDKCVCRPVQAFKRKVKIPDLTNSEEVPPELLPLKPSCAMEEKCSSCNIEEEIRETHIL